LNWLLGPEDKWRCVATGALRNFITTSIVIRYYRSTARLRASYTGRIEDAKPQSVSPEEADVEDLVEAEQVGEPVVPEQVPVDILCHRGTGRSRRFRVLWADGDETIEPFENLVDLVDGEEIVNERLECYCKEYNLELY
jgi:hypothetical protein